MVEQRSPKPLMRVQLLHPLPIKKLDTARVCGVFYFALLAKKCSFGYYLATNITIGYYITHFEHAENGR